MQYVRKGGVTRWSGGTITLSAGQSIDDDHPLLAERPDLFTEEAPGASIRSGRAVVERATRAPGEVRQTPGTGPKAAGRRGKPVENTELPEPPKETDTDE